MKLEDCEQTAICDECKHEFPAKDCFLEEFGNNVSMPFASIMFIDKDGKIVGGQPNVDDKVFGCPKCKHIHLFGFNIK